MDDGTINIVLRCVNDVFHSVLAWILYLRTYFYRCGSLPFKISSKIAFGDSNQFKVFNEEFLLESHGGLTTTFKEGSDGLRPSQFTPSSYRITGSGLGGADRKKMRTLPPLWRLNRLRKDSAARTSIQKLHEEIRRAFEDC